MTAQVPLMSNLYTQRTATSEAPCFVCSKFCITVLTNSVDWFYVCPSHISDAGFCKPASAPSSSPKPPRSVTSPSSQISVASRPSTPSQGQQQKPSKDTDVSQPAESGGLLSTITQTLGQTLGLSSAPPATPQAPPEAQPEEKAKSQQAVAKPAQYILTNNIYYLREAQQRKKAQQRVASQVTSQMPSVPRSNVY
ncbi:uncharacterized protein SPPG_01664 [Spizellomyces punctatus DAOM BR117]|uniref:VPS4-associated protein 1 n=1 Tax=Spizellomyces punctatus (strain DAOM BR117) TaxID=645134 RepID=A0A0L0HSZ6_SPIPD|nr:uncharacterized protein SPPG_01664 [Spizellomyces punctatus DAOM BR117]KND04233.1 hypothetical protein SPPG_01664 [Spizellomyces punctatus DAOM BR117]|eukprot:XP_016612272.1 hypothetical protein SPPG_01664 [Spizellomyces punctatus DAOM BR117]